MYKGIDVSHHQGEIDWKKVQASGITFAMLRACYGWDNDNQIDRQLYNNVQGCEGAGMPYGLYHYSYASNPEEAAREAAFFLRVIKGMKPSYPVAFDFEEASQLKLPLEQQLAIIDTFLGQVEQAGYYGVLYMSASPLERLRSYAPKRIDRYDCWVAHVEVEKPAYSGSYGLWQYTWKGKVDGIAGDVDLDDAYKDYPQIIRNAGLNGWKQEVSTPEEADYKAKYFETLALLNNREAQYASLVEELRALVAKA